MTSLLEIFDQEAQQAATLPIQQLQYPIQRSWAAEGNVAFVEFIQWSKGFIAPQPNQSYVTLLGGIVVSALLVAKLYHVEEPVWPASYEQR